MPIDRASKAGSCGDPRREGWTIVLDYAPNSRVRYNRKIFDKSRHTFRRQQQVVKGVEGGQMSIRDVLGTFFGNTGKSVQLQAEIRDGIANQAELINQRLKELIEQQINQSARNEQLFRELLAAVANQTNSLNQRLTEFVKQQANEDGRK
jgi:hypothetical protein